MTETGTKVVVHVFLEKASSEIRVVFLSNCAGSDQAAELWCGKKTGRGFIFHQDAYYDEILRNRRNNGNMISPISPLERLIYIGAVWGSLPINEDKYFLLSKTEIQIPIVYVD